MFKPDSGIAFSLVDDSTKVPLAVGCKKPGQQKTWAPNVERNASFGDFKPRTSCFSLTYAVGAKLFHHTAELADCSCLLTAHIQQEPAVSLAVQPGALCAAANSVM